MGRHHARRLGERGDVELALLDPPLGLEPPPGLRPDFVVVASPTALHVEQALPWLERGLPCLVEKPLAPSLAQAAALAPYPQLMCGHIERYNPAVRALRERLSGQAAFLQAERIAPWSGRGLDMDVLADLMVHDLDLARLFLGEPLRELRAVGLGVKGGQADICDVRLELGSGVAHLVASRVSREARRSLRLVEPGRYWSADLRAGRLFCVPWGEGELDPRPIDVPDGDALSAQHAAFLAFVRGEKPNPTPVAEGLASLRLVEQLREAVAARG
jgi:predicted dehydrogenase